MQTEVKKGRTKTMLKMKLAADFRKCGIGVKNFFSAKLYLTNVLCYPVVRRETREH